MTALPADLDYLATRVHARFGRHAEALGPDPASRLRSLEALWRAALPGVEPSSAGELQRRLLLSWWLELEELANALDGARARLLSAMADGVLLEDRKARVRSLAAELPPAALDRELLVPAATAPSSARSASDEPPVPVQRSSLPRPLAVEITLDQRHQQRLVAALAGLGRWDRREVGELVRQEVDHFHLLLVARGRFTHGLDAETLLAWHVPGAAIGRARLAAMLASSSLAGAAALALGHALDALPPTAQLDARSLDAAAWRRWLRLARRTFRGGGSGLAALVGYAALRRVEVKNLSTLSEALRLGLPPAADLPLIRRMAVVARA